MQLDKLELDLHPRPNSQALDLGFGLLRAHAGSVYAAWLALWLPLLALCCGVALYDPDYTVLMMIVAWWLRPLLERAPLYILARAVFGEPVRWQDAVRAWPTQLGGGWFRLLTWWRPFAAGRSLYQPIWQLEGARGKVAAERRKALGKDGTARAAYWFGVVCAHLEVVLQLGLFAFIGFFVSDGNTMNPFALLTGKTLDEFSTWAVLISFAGYGIGVGIIGPIYVACGFTLYLNRRATLEAWDIEIMLRQIQPPTKTVRAGLRAFMAWLPLTVLALWLAQPMPAAADTAADLNHCTAPPWAASKNEGWLPAHDAQQQRLRKEVAQLFDSADLRNYQCVEAWQRKKRPEPGEWKGRDPLPDLTGLAEIVKLLLIASALCFAAWLLYRYRDQLGALLPRARPQTATEIAGLDIRPESLPPDVPAAVRRLWREGRQRAALALLYRATLSRLANEDGLLLTKGATENDCLRLANRANTNGRLDASRVRVTADATGLWLGGAYGNHWPDDAALEAICVDWQVTFAPAAAEAEQS
ncbi:MAG: hypothetical protein JSS58_05710 [Proteobacteria bacterium]|nr:hypothetical protein [Pseudomonadota bacterium]